MRKQSTTPPLYYNLGTWWEGVPYSYKPESLLYKYRNMLKVWIEDGD